MRLYAAVAKQLARLDDPVKLILRATIGWLMILHGLFKINDLGLDNFENYVLKPVGLPLISVMRWLIPSMEIGLGILLMVGLLTRVAAAILSLEMLGTGFLVKLGTLHSGVLGPKGSGGAEVDFLMLVGLLAVVVFGPGFLSIDSLLGLDRNERAVQATSQQPARLGTGGEYLTREAVTD